MKNDKQIAVFKNIGYETFKSGDSEEIIIAKGRFE